jgi:LysM repeat protein/outer membrane murein-binding lipoprotein Lpp
MKKFLVVWLILAILFPWESFASSNQVIEDSLTVVIKKGDTIWKIAKRYLKNPREWRIMMKHEGNRYIRNPNRIYPGQVITIPINMLKEEYAKKFLKSEEVEKLKAQIDTLKKTIKEKNEYIAKLKKELEEKYAYIEEQELKITRFQEQVSTLTMSLNNKDLLLKEKEKELKSAKGEVERLNEKIAMLEREYQEAKKAVKADKMVARAIICIEQAKQKGASRYEKKLIKNAELLKEKAAWAMIRREYDKSIVLAEEAIRDASEAEHIAASMAGKYKLSFLFEHFYFWDLKNKPALLKTK